MGNLNFEAKRSAESKIKIPTLSPKDATRVGQPQFISLIRLPPRALSTPTQLVTPSIRIEQWSKDYSG